MLFIFVVFTQKNNEVIV